MTETSGAVPAALKPRIDWPDTVRFFACVMVVLAHSIDPYVFTADAKVSTIMSFMVTAVRPCVPFFIMLSGALLLPMRGTSENFFKRRFSRVLIPFFIWSVAYALFPVPGKVVVAENALSKWLADPQLYNLLTIPVNFNTSNVHFWFIFVLLGLYLFVPVFSPWVEKASKKSLLVFLSIWGFTLLLPYMHYFGFKEVFGECAWNLYGTFYPFSGYIGYMLLGYFLMKYNTLSLKKALLIGIPMIIVGFWITRFGFVWTVDHFVDRDRDLETFIGHLTPNVVMMTTGLFIILQKIHFYGVIQRFIRSFSELSYGIYLSHYIISIWVMWLIGRIHTLYFPEIYHTLLDATGWEWLRAVAENPQEFLPIFEILSGAVIVLILATLVTFLLSKLPKSKWLIG